jgi:hypothetical protein
MQDQGLLVKIASWVVVICILAVLVAATFRFVDWLLA